MALGCGWRVEHTCIFGAHTDDGLSLPGGWFLCSIALPHCLPDHFPHRPPTVPPHPHPHYVPFTLSLPDVYQAAEQGGGDDGIARRGTLLGGMRRHQSPSLPSPSPSPKPAKAAQKVADARAADAGGDDLNTVLAARRDAKLKQMGKAVQAGSTKRAGVAGDVCGRVGVFFPILAIPHSHLIYVTATVALKWLSPPHISPISRPRPHRARARLAMLYP